MPTRLKFNKHQKENLAKYFYVISQILFGSLVVGSLARQEGLDMRLLLGGIISAIVVLLVALRIDRFRR